MPNAARTLFSDRVLQSLPSSIFIITLIFTPDSKAKEARVKHRSFLAYFILLAILFILFPPFL